MNGLSCADVLLKNYSLTQQDKIFCLTMAQYPNVGALHNTDLQLEKYKTVGDSNFVPTPLAVENAYCRVDTNSAQHRWWTSAFAGARDDKSAINAIASNAAVNMDTNYLIHDSYVANDLDTVNYKEINFRH